MNIKRALATVAALGIGFQVGHFAEHLSQAGMWLFGDKSHAWMSPLAMWLSMHLGPMPLGMELLHLLGNTVFLITLAAIYALKPSKWSLWALRVEGFHLSEHLMLTASVAGVGVPLGWSTMFGLAQSWPVEAAVGYRVMWHFVMNLIPTALMLRSVLEVRFTRTQNLHSRGQVIDLSGAKSLCQGDALPLS